MKELQNIKPSRSLFPIIGLAFLLLLSPCKVRNFIQAELGVPQTEVANRSQTSLSSSNCSISEVVTTPISKIDSSTQEAPVFAAKHFDLDIHRIAVSKAAGHFHKERNLSVSSIPLYILYKNFKAFL
ncbi:hypothetical protein ES731_11935 [Psychroflexus gondwanensis]|uniref:hypothetical protein n=1 Tax=Psychroflexus gondwanensis TaxID=251 RepID=UPI00058E246E|nr:hypothetical protein [Psychroflexus gondwanensis]TXE17554.1 hypothetical protein ES731_11935 [Psychroflexus gondwanensis]